MTDAVKENEIAANLAHAAEWMEDPVAVERGDLKRIGEALGEISRNLTHVRREWGDDEHMRWMFEAIVESVGLLHSMQGRCFMPDPTDEGGDDEDGANGAQEAKNSHERVQHGSALEGAAQ